MSLGFRKRMAAGAALLWVAGCGLYGVDGNGKRVDEVRPVGVFSEISSDASLDVQVTRGDAFRVAVSIDSNLVHAVRTDVSGDVLWVDVGEPIGDTVGGPHVLVTMPVLRRAALNGSGSLRADGFDQAEPVSLALDGSGDLSFTGAAPTVTVRASGSGDTRLHGTTPALDVALDGSGSVDARDLDATTADLSLNGSGDIAARVSTSARVALSGSGDIDLYGTASIDSIDVSGSGSINRH
jgi:hypothetical protein